MSEGLAALLQAKTVSGLDFPTYAALVDLLVAERRTSGHEPTERRIELTRLNQVRMRRLVRTVHVNNADLARLKNAIPQTWLVLTEAWCGDSAQIIPVLEVLAEASGHIALRMVLRDENPDLMERYLTNGGRSIPKVIAFNAEGRELFTWGPRPAPAQTMVMDNKALPEGIRRPKEEVEAEMHAWYTRDAGVTIMKEIISAVTAVS